jgi:hypothetical protein
VLEAPKEIPIKEDSIIDLLINCPDPTKPLDDFNTGFGNNNELHCPTKHDNLGLQTPLYKDNYFKEFVTEEETAAARHALGLYNKGDVVAMSMLTTEDTLPSEQDWEESTIK